MITNKMRRILVNELNYLESEVDDMEPQVIKNSPSSPFENISSMTKAHRLLTFLFSSYRLQRFSLIESSLAPRKECPNPG